MTKKKKTLLLSLILTFSIANEIHIFSRRKERILFKKLNFCKIYDKSKSIYKIKKFN